jgi:hypothetical protein
MCSGGRRPAAPPVSPDLVEGPAEMRKEGR